MVLDSGFVFGFRAVSGAVRAVLTKKPAKCRAGKI